MDEPQGRWRLKREVSTGDLLLAVSIGLGVIYWGNGIERRVSSSELTQQFLAQQVKDAQDAQKRVDAAQDQQVRDSVARIEGSIRDMQQVVLAQRKTAP
jgi:hypothetical protein